MATINKTEEHINRGVEFILKGGNKKPTSKTITIGNRSMTLDTILVLVLGITFIDQQIIYLDYFKRTILRVCRIF